MWKLSQPCRQQSRHIHFDFVVNQLRIRSSIRKLAVISVLNEYLLYNQKKQKALTKKQS